MQERPREENITGTERGNVLVVPIEEGLSSDGVLNINASTPNWSQQVEIRRDTISPRMNSHSCDISNSAEEDEERGNRSIHFHMEFSERIYAAVTNETTCPNLRHLGTEYSAGASTHPSTPSPSHDCFDPLVLCSVHLLNDSQACFFGARMRNLSDVFTIEGIDSEPEVIVKPLPTSSRSFHMNVDVYLTARTDADVTLIVPKGSLMDKAGNILEESINISSAFCERGEDLGAICASGNNLV